ncbi:MAG TPA: endonuclease/exonuclease/phosphatase family protein [Candidatus Dormibacteraeota bacterium]
MGITLVAILLIAHASVPRAFALGALWESVAPWTAVLVIAGAGVATVRRSPLAGAASLLLVIVWVGLCEPMLFRHPVARAGALRVVTHNVLWINADPPGTARVLLRAQPDLLPLQEVQPDAVPVYAGAFQDRLPYHVVLDRDAIWSRWPIRDAATLDLGEGWTGIHRAVVEAPGGDVVLYAVHLPRPNPISVRQPRDLLLAALAATVQNDRAPRLLVAGDLDAGEMDSALKPLTGRLRDAAAATASGPAFTWPTWAPAVATDHVLSRGLRPTSAEVLPATGSDHRPLLVQLSRA